MTCASCQQPFTIFDEDRKFYEKFQVPEPKNCPTCRMIRRFMERNPKSLHYRTCNATNKKTLSQYHESAPFPVYSPKAWWADSFDATKYGREFDFSRGFFEQFLELKNQVPHMALFNIEGTMENSDFNNCTGYLKNCYLIAESDFCEDCYYSNLLKKTKDIVDCSIVYESELCYECVDVQNGYHLLYSKDCNQCRDSYFLENCQSCSDCISCINLRHKQYYIFNKPYSKEKYEQLKKSFQLDTSEGVQSFQEKSREFFLAEPHKYAIAEKNENSSGDHLYYSKNAFHCFDARDLEDCRYCQKLSLGVKDSMDYNSWGMQSELMYQCSSIGDHCYNVKFCVACEVNMRDSEYCYECFSSSDVFGCVGLKKEKYCILNKKYSREEYVELKRRIIKHMKQLNEYGEFFPIDFCTFGYNETLAMDMLPLTREQALKKGYTWREDGAREHLPESDAMKLCSCGKNFKLIPQEIRFYERMQIPIPKKCPSCRHRARIARRNPLQLWPRNCDKCKTQINTGYAPNRKEIIYCEKCYLEIPYGIL